jgi:nuclear pore complex protein Nup133
MLNQRFRRTALFSVLQIAARDSANGGHARFVILRPEQALQPPTMEEIASRWPGLTPEQVEAMQQDYLGESEGLHHLRLDDVFERVKEIAME